MDVDDSTWPDAMRSEQERHEAMVGAGLSRIGDVMLARRSEQQIRLADRIYRHLKDGGRIEEVQDLVEQLGRTSTEDLRRGRRG